jgi:hypothetical protein
MNEVNRVPSRKADFVTNLEWNGWAALRTT